VAKKLVGHHEALLERVRLQPDITLSELQGWLLKTFGVSSSIGGLWNTLNKLGLSFKNMPCCRTDAA
jgi:transposase